MADTTATLITRPGTLVVYTAEREVDAVSAAARGLAEYLGTLRGPAGVGGRELSFTESLWHHAEPEQQVTYPAVIVLPSGDVALEDTKPTTDASMRLPAPDNRFVFKVGEAVVLLQVELHCTDPFTRAGLLALVQDALCPVDWMYGCRLVLPFYHGAHAAYAPRTVTIPDDAESAQQRIRIARVQVEAHVPVLRVSGFRATAAPRVRVEVDEL